MVQGSRFKVDGLQLFVVRCSLFGVKVVG